MDYFPNIYASPPNASHLSRQSHSYCAQDSQSSTQSPYKDELPQDSKYFTASVGRSNKISHHLFPLISKFEALDALSHSIQIPSLRPAPLQVSRNSSPRRGGVVIPSSINFEAIFSPRRRSQSRHEGMFLENMISSPPEDVFTSSTIKKSGSAKLKQTHLSSKVTNIRLRGGIPQNNLATLKESDSGTGIRGHTGGAKETMKGTKENGIVKERIKLFDGCMEHTSPYPHLDNANSAHGSPFSATIAAQNNNARPSIRQSVAPTTRTYHKLTCFRCNVTKPPSGLSTTRGSKPKWISTKSGTPKTPTKPYPKCDAKGQVPFRQSSPDPFLHVPYTSQPTRQTSPKTLLTSQKTDSRGLIGRPLYTANKAPDPTKKDASLEEKKGPTRVKEPPAKRGNPVSRDKREISEKLEARHRVKSLERACDTMIDWRELKDKDMKMLCEKGMVVKIFESGPWSHSKETGTKISKPKWRDFPNATPSAPTPYVPPPSAARTIRASSKLTQNPRQMGGTRISSLVPACPSTPAKATCRGIHNKIKRWESKAGTRGKVAEERKDYSSHKSLDNSISFRKSMFGSPWNDEVGKELKKRGLDRQEVQAVVDEFQDIGEELGDSNKEKWKMVVAPRLGKGGLATTQHNRGTGEGYRDMDMRIIVREAQCGLAEPKPLRLLEMKRIILLCRERVSVVGPT